MSAARRFPIRFDRWYRVLSSALWLRPSDSYVEVDGRAVTVRMGWAFRARVPLGAVSGSAPFAEVPLSRGVHGLGGRWLVNGSGQGIVAVAIDPPQRGWVLGFPVRLRELLVSVDDPSAFIAALRRRAAD